MMKEPATLQGVSTPLPAHHAYAEQERFALSLTTAFSLPSAFTPRQLLASFGPYPRADLQTRFANLLLPALTVPVYLPPATIGPIGDIIMAKKLKEILTIAAFHKGKAEGRPLRFLFPSSVAAASFKAELTGIRATQQHRVVEVINHG